MNIDLNILISSLPKELGEMIKQSAASIGCPIEYTFAGYLACMSIVIGNSHRLEIKPKYEVRAQLYVGVLGDPGSKKTPSIDLMLKPISSFQEKLYEEYREKFQEESDLKEKPKLVQIITSDATTEALSVMLYNTPHGIIVYKDEWASLFKSFNQYKSSGGDMEYYLSYWSGSNITVNRKSQEMPIFVKNPNVIIIGGIQPSVLKDVPNFKDNGFPERFLYFYPDASGNKYSTYQMENKVFEDYHKIIIEFLERYKAISDTENPKIVRFSSDAQAKWDGWATALSEEIHSNSVPLYLKSYWSKLESYAGRLALLFELCGNQYITAECEAVSLESLDKSILSIEYFKEEARKVWKLFDEDPSHDKRIEKARDWIKERAIKGFITRREFVSHKVAGTKNNPDADAIFEELELLGFGKVTDRFKSKAGNNLQGFIMKESPMYNRV